MNVVEMYRYSEMIQSERLSRAQEGGWALNLQPVRKWLSTVERWTAGAGRVYLETESQDPSRAQARLEACR